MILDDDDLERLTGIRPTKRRRPACCAALDAMGVKYGRRLDGWPIVTAAAVLDYCGQGAPGAPQKRGTLNLAGLG